MACCLRILVLFTVWGCALLGACSKAVRPKDEQRGPLPESREVVAVVNGVPIPSERVASHARALGITPRQALEDLIAFELLAEEATRRGFAHHKEVTEAGKREMVRKLIQREFEPGATLTRIPETEIRREYERNKRFFNRPELRTVVTVLFPAKKGVASPADEARAHSAAQELANRWRAEKPRTPEAARAIVDTYFGHLGGLRVDRFNTHKDAEAEPSWLRAALALRSPGEVSAPVRTRFGWHVIWLEEIHPARSTPEEEALETIRKEFHPLWQKAQFARFAQEIQKKHTVEVYPEKLTSVSLSSGPPPSP